MGSVLTDWSREENVLEQKVDWLAAMEVKTELYHAEAKANDAGEWAVLLWSSCASEARFSAPKGEA